MVKIMAAVKVKENQKQMHEMNVHLWMLGVRMWVRPDQFQTSA